MRKTLAVLVSVLIAIFSHSGMARYITSDPIGIEGGNNTYGYAGTNPLVFVDPYGLAYFALRPLEGMAGKPTCGNTIGNKLNIQFSHEQLFFEDRKTPGNLGFFSDSQVREDSSQNLDKYSCRSAKFDDCIMREAVQNVPGGRYCLLGQPGSVEKNNCQDWASRVRDEYDRIKNTAAVANCKTCVP